MPETRSTILIPDISGYTEFITATELKHGSMAINMFLDSMVNAIGDEYEVSEIEGDALLLIKKGDPPTQQELTGTCLRIFNAFHFQRQWMQQHAICPCNACQEIKHLTLKFVAHHGPLAEVKVGRIVKQSGTDMIVAHRLLKNSIPANEYLLMTDKILPQEPTDAASSAFTWNRASEEYPSLGKIGYQYALLHEFRKKSPGPPEPEVYVFHDDLPFKEIEINAHYRDVYMILKHIPDWAIWMPDLQQVEQAMPEPFIGSLHYCSFEGYKTVISPLSMRLNEGSIQYAESCQLEEMNILVFHEYECRKTDDQRSVFRYRFIEHPDHLLPMGIKSRLEENQQRMAAQLKDHCEKMEDSFF